jgi:hypothetical protein
VTRFDGLLDMGNDFVSEGGRLVEYNAARVLNLYPSAHVTRTRDAIQVDVRTDADEERGVTVLVTPEAFEIRLPTIEWTMGAYGPVHSTRYVKRVGADGLMDTALADLLANAITKRDAEFIPCRFCGTPTPPEHRHGKACHGCSERHLAVVH